MFGEMKIISQAIRQYERVCKDMGYRESNHIWMNEYYLVAYTHTHTQSYTECFVHMCELESEFILAVRWRQRRRCHCWCWSFPDFITLSFISLMMLTTTNCIIIIISSVQSSLVLCSVLFQHNCLFVCFSLCLSNAVATAGTSVIVCCWCIFAILYKNFFFGYDIRTYV